MSAEINQSEKIPFRQYVENLTPELKKELIKTIQDYISSSNFYHSLRNNKFSKLSQYYLESVIGQKFEW
ncbi:MAG TPA: hypothetical protein VK152_06735 [Paludibacter sp.]|nr:hypothetical protein [Paludibacter sp.]